MLAPIRCFSCGALVADKYEEFASRVKSGEEPEKVLDSLGAVRYCCRRMLVSNVEIVDQILPYYEALARRREEFESEQI